jgi:hypothetical protein
MPFNWRKLHAPTLENFDNKQWRAQLTVLVQEDEEIREDAKRVCKTNLLALCWVLGFCLIDEHDHHDAVEFFIPKEPGLTLDEWLAHARQYFKRQGSLLWPRGSYKTTINLANCTQLILCWPLTVAIMVMTGRKDLAIDFVDQVGGFFYRPKGRAPTLFQAIFPEMCVDKLPEGGTFTSPLRQIEPRIIEPAIWAESVESGISGYHPNVLVIDDVSNNRNSQTFEARQKITKKYKLNRKVLVAKGIELKVGTIYGTGDLFTDEILTARPGTIRRLVKPALRLKSGERLDPNGFPDEDDVELMFPKILPYDYLRAEYEAGFESFMTQYQLDEFGAAEVVFTQDQIMTAMIEDAAIPMEGRYFIHWRFPCIRRQWKTAAAAVGILARNRCYLIEVMEGHYKPSVLAQNVVKLARKYSLHRISVEDSPGAALMTSAIRNYALTVGWDTNLQWIGGGDEIEDTGERDLRIRNIEAVLAGGRLLFNSDMAQLRHVIMQFQQYGMIPNFAIPDVVSRIADNLPQSIAAEDLEDEDASWQSAREVDKYNMIYNRGIYARPEPEPQEEVIEEPAIEDQQLTAQGLEIWIPGLE